MPKFLFLGILSERTVFRKFFKYEFISRNQINKKTSKKNMNFVSTAKFEWDEENQVGILQTERSM